MHTPGARARAESCRGWGGLRLRVLRGGSVAVGRAGGRGGAHTAPPPPSHALCLATRPAHTCPLYQPTSCRVMDACWVRLGARGRVVCERARACVLRVLCLCVCSVALVIWRVLCWVDGSWLWVSAQRYYGGGSTPHRGGGEAAVRLCAALAPPSLARLHAGARRAYTYYILRTDTLHTAVGQTTAAPIEQRRGRLAGCRSAASPRRCRPGLGSGRAATLISLRLSVSNSHPGRGGKLACLHYLRSQAAAA